MRIAWANQACLDFCGALSLEDLTRVKFHPKTPFIKQLSTLSRQKTKANGVRELIRFPTKDGEFVFDCLCKNKEIEPGRAGVLVELVADKGKTASLPMTSPPIASPSKDSSQNELPAQEAVHKNGLIKPGDQPLETISPPVQTLDFDVGREVNGFSIEVEKVDEDDLMTLREIARMINGSGGLGLGHSAASGNENLDGRPSVATRKKTISGTDGKSTDAQASERPARGPVSAPLPGQSPDGAADETTGSSGVPVPQFRPPRNENPSNTNSDRNYFLESLPAALAIAMGGRLMRANEAFLYAFGFATESELRKAGGLAALFPDSQNGVLVDEQRDTGISPQARKTSRSASARVTTLGVSRSGRKRRIPINFRNVSTGREPVQILILHEDALAREDDLTLSAGGESPRMPDDPETGNLGQDSIDFLATVSHEVRTPLNSIIGFSELMKDERFGVVDGDKFRGYAGDIHDSAMHALSLINDLLDITKIMAGKPDLEFEPVNANEVVTQALSTMRTQAERKDISLIISLGKRLPALYADKRSLKQILLNLISNAIKFTPDGGEVSVSSNLTGSGSVRLRVGDTGVGMRKDQITTALEPFAQIDPARPASGEPAQIGEKGTGLGLPLTKALVKAHYAGFAINSSPGQGTKVDVLFPPDRLVRQVSMDI